MTHAYFPDHRYAVGSVVSLNQSIPRRSGGVMLRLEAGQQFLVHRHTDHGGQPEYSLRDAATGDVWANIPEHTLDGVTTTVPASLFDMR